LPPLSAGSLLHIIDRPDAAAPSLPSHYSRFRPIGLDKTIEERGIRSLGELDDGAAAAAPDTAGGAGKLFRAISPVRTRQSE
jgi:hypothetical protein